MQYGKIYIHLGINDLGNSLDDFAAQYQRAIYCIRQLQPDAHIILQTVLILTEDYSPNPIFRQENIRAMNLCIRELAEKNGLFFSDVNLIMADDSGYLREELTFDGCHLYGSGCEMWAQWLQEEAATFQIP